ncbi:altronate dehydratase family protein [Candidatus Pelagibacter sp.]|jgi:altronate dehydratase|nr:altronate dehydratase family protein [Candidatus Pelagibacter sp.]MDB9987643.1 altronate dehydratase family protein [Candidatus Pelagibacter sp.]
MQNNLIVLNKNDNVAVTPFIIPANTKIEGQNISSIDDIPFGHKICLKTVNKGDPVIKYDQIIGFASTNINPGEHVHSHNLEFKDFDRKFKVIEKKSIINEKSELFFNGIMRDNGQVATRNYIGIISTVNCSATVTKMISEKIKQSNILKDFPNIDGIVPITHSTGCGMNTESEGMQIFQRTIDGFKNHPNFSHVFVLGLGCECAQVDIFKDNVKQHDRVHFLTIQDEGGTKKIVDKVLSEIKNLLVISNNVKREPLSVNNITLALQCGGSDGYSGISANPALGVAADMLVKQGGSSILSETPEIYGAEHLLINRANKQETADKLIAKIKWWQHYTSINNSSMDNNPAPGNKKGGLTTILEKSLGAVAKGGNSVLEDVLSYAEPLKNKGFNFMDSPGYDPVSVTGQVASGANVICFTTGRGSCFGCKPAPSLKLSTNTTMYEKMIEDMDINCGTIIEGKEEIEEVGKKIFKLVIATASGSSTKSELNGYGDEEFNPWQVGVVM